MGSVDTDAAVVVASPRCVCARGLSPPGPAPTVAAGVGGSTSDCELDRSGRSCVLLLGSAPTFSVDGYKAGRCGHIDGALLLNPTPSSVVDVVLVLLLAAKTGGAVSAGCEVGSEEHVRGSSSRVAMVLVLLRLSAEKTRAVSWSRTRQNS